MHTHSNVFSFVYFFAVQILKEWTKYSHSNRMTQVRRTYNAVALKLCYAKVHQMAHKFF